MEDCNRSRGYSDDASQRLYELALAAMRQLRPEVDATSTSGKPSFEGAPAVQPTAGKGAAESMAHVDLESSTGRTERQLHARVPYVPQFSSATQVVLDRVNTTQADRARADALAAVLQLPQNLIIGKPKRPGNMPERQTTGSELITQTMRSLETAQMAQTTQTTRTIQTRTRPPAPVCTRCDGGPRFADDRLACCGRCGIAWHRTCHVPKVAWDTAAGVPPDWQCATCSGSAGDMLMEDVVEEDTRMNDCSDDASELKRTLRLEAPSGSTTTTTAAMTTTIHCTPPGLARRVSWAHHPLTRRQEYLRRQTRRDLLHLLWRSIELYPELPIFPAEDGGDDDGVHGHRSYADTPIARRFEREPNTLPLPSLSAMAAQHQQQRSVVFASAAQAQNTPPAAVALEPPAPPVFRNGIINSIRKSSAHQAAAAMAAAVATGVATNRAHVVAAFNKSSVSRARGRSRAIRIVSNKDGAVLAQQQGATETIVASMATTTPATSFRETLDDPDEEDPTGLLRAWPVPGRGLYARLRPDGEDEVLVDRADQGAFSHLVYDEGGRKIVENGMPVLVVQ